MRSIVRALALIAALVALAGCSGSEGQVLRSWRLHGEGAARSIDLPVHLELPERVEPYRLSAEVELAPELLGRDVELVLPYLPAPVTLRSDGRDAAPSVSEEDERGMRHIGPHRFEIPASAVHDGRVHLELSVLNTWTQATWLDVPPRLVAAGATTPVLARNRIFNERGGWFGLVALSQMGLTFLAVYFWDTRRRAYLWFAIQALSASYYPAHVLGLTTFLGGKLETVLLAESLSVAPIISVYYTHEFFGRGSPHRFWLILLGVAMVIPLPALLHPFIDSSYGTPGVVACVGTAIVYQVATGIRLVSTWSDRRIGLFFLCCWLALGGSAWIDLYAWIGSGELLAGARPACFGLGFFGIFQSMLLSRSHFRSLEEADRLNTTLRGRLDDLEARQAEIEALNEELRQQVGRRSAHILAALTLGEAAAASTTLEPGDVVEERYRVIGALGSGGMGTVYEVERLHDRRRLALKVTHEARGLALARLAREAQIATRVRHPNVVSVVDADVSQAGYVYLVMELVEGISLAESEGAHDPTFCLKILVQILAGLRALHAQGIVHRDLKPGNVLLSGDVKREPHVKITDFGISRGPEEPEAPAPEPPRTSADPATVRMAQPKAASMDATAADVGNEHRRAPHTPSSSMPQLTRTGAISGTPSYIAPELATRGAAITPAVDVFSFGVVAYRLLTGAPPHGEAPFLAQLDGRVPPAHVPLSVPGLPAFAARRLDACLSFSPAERPTTDELMATLTQALETTAPALAQVDAAHAAGT